MKKFRQVLESVDPISENINKSSKELGKEINDAARKETGGDKKDFMNVSKLISQGKHKDAAKYMSKLDTAVLEDLVTFIMGHEDVFKVMYPKARPGQPVALFAREETEIVEAMSEKDKAKRLALIKKAVERINKGNAEKAKKDALAMMKASGMFDEDFDESTIEESTIEEAAPKMKKLGFYGSEIGGLRQGNKYYSAKPVEVKGKVGFRVTDEFGSFETIDLKTFAKRFG